MKSSREEWFERNYEIVGKVIQVFVDNDFPLASSSYVLHLAMQQIIDHGFIHPDRKETKITNLVDKIIDICNEEQLTHHIAFFVFQIAQQETIEQAIPPKIVREKMKRCKARNKINYANINKDSKKPTALPYEPQSNDAHPEKPQEEFSSVPKRVNFRGRIDFDVIPR